VSNKSANAIEHPDAFFEYPGATDVWSGTRMGIDELTYKVSARFPADDVIAWISDKLANEGWKQLNYDFMNSYYVKGWEEFLKGPKSTSCIHQWTGDWQDASGNVIRYIFRYERPCHISDMNATSKLTDLDVVAAYYTSEDVQQVQKRLKSLGKMKSQ
jgi:hypothetical protein